MGDRIISTGINDDRGLSMGREALILSEELYNRNSVHAAQSLSLISDRLTSTGQSDEELKIVDKALYIFRFMMEESTRM